MVAFLLIYESRELLIGERADSQVIQSIRRIVQADDSITAVQRLLTMHFGPTEVLLTLDLRFVSHLTGEEIANAIERLQAALRVKQPQITRIFVEARAWHASKAIIQ